ncbi:MAG: class I SAM-dependent methyltransferase [Pseudomonadota bacterium]
MMDINEEKLHEFVGKMLGDLGGAMSAPTVRLGKSLGLWKAMAGSGAMSAADLASKAGGIDERYVREWLLAQASNGYVDYHADDNTFELSPEQAMVFAVEDSPVYMQGAFDVLAAQLEGQAKVEHAFRTGEGVQWGDSAGCLFCAVGSFFRPTYVNSLVQDWLPALDGVESKLKAGGKVADVGCGVGFSTLLMAKAFPDSQFIGFDFHEPSIEEARKHAKEHGLSDRVRFETALAKEIGEGNFDLVTCFDCLHDMGDPAGCATHVHEMLKPDGTWMVCEPNAADTPAGNMNPVGRLYYNASTMICVPTSKAQEVGAALGAQAGEAKVSEVIKAGGFSQVRRATEGPFNMILEARP